MKNSAGLGEFHFLLRPAGLGGLSFTNQDKVRLKPTPCTRMNTKIGREKPIQGTSQPNYKHCFRLLWWNVWTGRSDFWGSPWKTKNLGSWGASPRNSEPACRSWAQWSYTETSTASLGRAGRGEGKKARLLKGTSVPSLNHFWHQQYQYNPCHPKGNSSVGPYSSKW